MDFMISLKASLNPSQDALSVAVTFTHELWLAFAGCEDLVEPVVCLVGHCALMQ